LFYTGLLKQNFCYKQRVNGFITDILGFFEQNILNMMKKLLPLFACILLLSVSSYAQPIVFGLKGGLDMTKLTGQAFGGNYSASFNAGVYATSKFNDKWGWQTEIVYNQGNEGVNVDGFQSVCANYANFNNSSSYTATIGAVTIPLLVTYKLNNFFSLCAGPQVSFNAYTDQNLFINGAIPFKVTDIWGCIGGKLDLNGVNFYLRYNNGFTDINKFGGDAWKNRQINFGLEVPIYTMRKKK